MAKIYYHAVPADWRKEQKYKFLDEHESVSKIDWTEITPDAKLRERPIGNILAAVRAVFVVGVEGEAGCIARQVNVRQ